MGVNAQLLSIGVLAHNEELNIEQTLNSLFAQDVFRKFSTEVVIVANGCSDRTAEIARQSLDAHRAIWSNLGSARVEELVLAGKANAWNQFVHELSSRSASILVLMDADITILNTDTVSSMVTTLDRNPPAVVCVDRPVKDIAMAAKRTLFQSLLAASTPEVDTNIVPLCGQLYCASSSELRLIKLPVQITGEDGFLRALLLTRGFTMPENAKRIIFDPTAAHSFTSVATFRELFKHEKWIVSSSIINMLLFERFWKECTKDVSAMTLMQRWEDQEPEWLARYVRCEVRRRGWRLLPRSWWTRRWARLRLMGPVRRLQRAPVAAIAALVDILVFIAAIRDVRRGRVFRYWGRI